jgi:hypothetical protein
MNTTFRTAAALCFSLASLAATGCIDQDPDLAGGEELELSQVDQAVTSCSPTITAAAITRQISGIYDPVVDITIVTISPAPTTWQLANVTGGPATVRTSNYSTSCTLRADNTYRCAHSFRLSPGAACYASGNYTLTVRSLAEAGSCGTGYNGTVQNIPFSIQTENMCSYDFDGVADGY